ncbi:zinc finger protein [Stylonychia lemnae]|uniref:RING-type E3 ubiquitin transferase n=1 Tax=Stylonychia lemnae TaxID=5949 RepID=A0A078A404_STYLE|nr:zinc finger protein [Stylonychia lemnae]|eukprot:CDW76609.1 zinc finger protein [Stylonychia lemnae]
MAMSFKSGRTSRNLSQNQALLSKFRIQDYITVQRSYDSNLVGSIVDQMQEKRYSEHRKIVYVDMEIFVLRYYILIYSILVGLTVILYFWFNAKTDEGQEYEKWYLTYMVTGMAQALGSYLLAKKVQYTYQKDYRLIVCKSRFLIKIKAPPKTYLKYGFTVIDLAHIGICIWGLVIYIKNFTFIQHHFQKDPLILITCPLLSSLGFLSIIRLFVYTVFFIVVPNKAVSFKKRRINSYVQHLESFKFPVILLGDYLAQIDAISAYNNIHSASLEQNPYENLNLDTLVDHINSSNNIEIYQSPSKNEEDSTAIDEQLRNSSPQKKQEQDNPQKIQPINYSMVESNLLNTNSPQQAQSALSMAQKDKLPKCIVCYKKMKPLDEIVVLNCNIKHIYHKKCIKDWFKRNDDCPRCKVDVISQLNPLNENERMSLYQV